MLTLFACPKPFRGHIGVIQRNAIRSWTLLRPQPELILFGDEEGIAEFAAELGVRHVPSVARNEFGTPLLDDLFRQARELASGEVMCYVNADIILINDFIRTLQRVIIWRKQFLMVGQRRDVDIIEPLNFGYPEWESELRSLVSKSSKLRSTWYIDYFAFSRELYMHIPPLAIGRTCWDNWLIWNARASGIPVVDATPGVLAVHQNHDYSHHAAGESGVWQGEEAKRNLELVGGKNQMYNIDYCTHQSSPTGEIRWRPLRRPWLGVKYSLWMVFVHYTRGLRHQLGIHRQGWLKIGNPKT